MKRSNMPLLIAAVLGFIFTGSWAMAFTSEGSFGRYLHTSTLVGVKQHNRPCNMLPDQKTVTHILERNGEVVSTIQRLGRGNILISVGDVQGRCPGKADIFITYGSYAEGLSIEKFIGSDELFGIPYTLWNT